MPSTLHVVGPDPRSRDSRGPFLNLIVLEPSSTSMHA
jgi:hypothetical protein